MPGRLVKLTVRPLRLPVEPVGTVGSLPAMANSSRLLRPSLSKSSVGPRWLSGRAPLA